MSSESHLLPFTFLGCVHAHVIPGASEPRELNWLLFKGRSFVCTTLFRCTLLEMRGARLESRFYDQCECVILLDNDWLSDYRARNRNHC